MALILCFVVIALEGTLVILGFCTCIEKKKKKRKKSVGDTEGFSNVYVRGGDPQPEAHQEGLAVFLLWKPGCQAGASQAASSTVSKSKDNMTRSTLGAVCTSLTLEFAFPL